MEKFGIFELLDALSAIIGAPAQDAPPDPQEQKERRVPDAAFDPPAYGGDAAHAQEGGTALGSFLERHERTKDRAKK